jgi:O-antigen/teichoic acid export membrane protein
MLVSDMVGVLTPAASALEACDDRAGINRLLIAGTKYTLLISLPAAAVLMVMGDRFVELWMGPGYESSSLILVILTAGTLANLLEMPVDTVLRGLGKHKLVARFTIMQGVANLALSLALIKPLGLIGVAVGTAAPMIVFTAFAYPVYFRELGVSMKDWAYRSIPRPLAVQAAFLTMLYLLRQYGAPSSLLIFFAEVAGAFILYGVLAVAVCTTASERAAFLRAGDRLGLKLVSLI